MTGHSRESGCSPRTDIHELHSPTQPLSLAPFDVVRHAATHRKTLYAGEPLPSGLSVLARYESPYQQSYGGTPYTLPQETFYEGQDFPSDDASREAAPLPPISVADGSAALSNHLARAMSPGDTIYDMGAPRSQQRKDFTRGPAKFTPDQQGKFTIPRDQKHQLTSHDVGDLTNKNYKFLRMKEWESFSDPTITTRQRLNEAKHTLHSNTVRSAHITRKSTSELNTDEAKHRRSVAARNAHITKGPKGRRDAARKGRATLGTEACHNIVRKASAAYQQRGLERAGIAAFSEALEDTLWGNPAYDNPSSEANPDIHGTASQQG